jgi:MHS family proline/betaine transporter-like MFS transporter
MTQPALPLVPIGHAQRRRAILASVIGNGLEGVDFGIYGVFGGILSKLFFPTSDPAALMLVATATFGIAFVVRPIGGILFGMYADRAGRKAAMSRIILLMALGTGLIGVAPTYAMIGIAAPAIIILARVLQGLSAGGEFASATAMLIEYSPRHLRGFIGSFQMCSQALAFALGGAAGYLITHSMPPVDVESWGWRIPFLLGALIGPVGHYIRSRVDESPEFAAFLRNRAQAPRLSLIAVLRQYPRQLWSSFGLVVIGTASSYVVLIYIPLSAAAQLGIASADALLSLMFGAMCLLVLCPFAGWLADRFGTRNVMLPAVALFGFTAHYLLSALITAPECDGALSLRNN